MDSNHGISVQSWPPAPVPVAAGFLARLLVLQADRQAERDAGWAADGNAPATNADLLRDWEALAPVNLAVRLEKIDRETLDGWQVIEYLRAAGKVTAWASSMSTGALGRFAALRPPRPCEGKNGTGRFSRFAAPEIAAALHIHHGTAARILAEADVITGCLPRTFEAMEAGLIDRPRASVIAGAAADLPATATGAFEDAVVAAAPGLTPGQLLTRAEKQRGSLHPQPLAERHAAALVRTDVTVAPEPDAMAVLHAVLPADRARICYGIIDAAARALQGADEGRRIGELRGAVLYDLATAGPGPGGTGALCPLCTTAGPEHTGDAAGRGDGGGAGNRPGNGTGRPVNVPGMLVSVSLATLLGLSEEPGKIPGLGDIPAAVARELAGLAKSWLPVLTGGGGEFLRAARRKRVPPKGLRRWIMLRDGHCRLPGCDRPAAGCDIDHTTAWEDGGPTVPGNLELLCPAHHRLKHEAGWRIRQIPGPGSPGDKPGGDGSGGDYPGGPDPGGTIEWITPTGHRYTDDPPPF